MPMCQIMVTLAIDLHSVKEGFESFDIDDLALVESGHSLADCFSKPMAPTQLMDALRTGVIDHPLDATGSGFMGSS